MFLTKDELNNLIKLSGFDLSDDLGVAKLAYFAHLVSIKAAKYENEKCHELCKTAVQQNQETFDSLSGLDKLNDFGAKMVSAGALIQSKTLASSIETRGKQQVMNND